MSVTVSEITYYKAGVTTSATSAVVGYESDSRRVVRYTLQVEGQGANQLYVYHAFAPRSGVSVPTLCVNISTDPDIYKNTNGNISGYLAEMKVRSDINAFEVTLTDIILAPGLTYYLWVYPKTDNYAWVDYHRNTEYWEVTASGSAGLVYIDLGSGFEPYQCYIDNGSSWDLYIPYIDNGSSWDLCS